MKTYETQTDFEEDLTNYTGKLPPVDASTQIGIEDECYVSRVKRIGKQIVGRIVLSSQFFDLDAMLEPIVKYMHFEALEMALARVAYEEILEDKIEQEWQLYSKFMKGKAKLIKQQNRAIVSIRRISTY